MNARTTWPWWYFWPVPGNAKLHWCGLEWGQCSKGRYQYYFYWWNWLDKSARHWGIYRMYYDGPNTAFGLWWINFSWSTHWNKS